MKDYVSIDIHCHFWKPKGCLVISSYWNDTTSCPHDSLWYVRWHVWLCECIVNVWMNFWIYVATPTWIGHHRTVLVIEVLGIVNWLGRPAALFGGILRVKNLCWRQKSRYGRQKKTIVIFQRPVFEEWMLPNFRDLAHNLECKKIEKTPGISCLIGSASKHVAPQFWFKTQLPLSAPEEKGKQQIHLPYPILLLLYMFGLRIILQSNQSRKTRFKTIPD